MEDRSKMSKTPHKDLKPKESKGRQILRIGDTDLGGDLKLKDAIRQIYGVSFAYSNAILRVLGLDPRKALQDLDANSLQKLRDALHNPKNYGIPAWLYNCRDEDGSGENKHLIGDELRAHNNLVIQTIKLSGSYRGYRHQFSYKLRGQKTRSRGANFRGRVGQAVGVTKSKAQPQQQQQAQPQK